jgi:branched-chain amino acid transport system substrate-binding protein
VLAAEAAKAARIHGVMDINAPQMRDGSRIEITEEDGRPWSSELWSSVQSVRHQNHGGDGMVGVTQWDASARHGR